jgi:hypothetical protein
MVSDETGPLWKTPVRKSSYVQHQPVPRKNKPLRRVQTCCQTLMKGNRILRHLSQVRRQPPVRVGPWTQVFCRCSSDVR